MVLRVRALRRATLGIVGAVGLAALGACGADPMGGGTPAIGGGGAEQLAVTSYTSLAELANDVAVVAVVRADDIEMVSATEDQTSGLKAFAADVAVVQRLRGEMPAAAVLRLPEGDVVESDARRSPMASGHQYVVFANPFEWSRGHPNGEWVAWAAVYEVDGDRLVLTSDAGQGLPAETTMDELTRQIV